MEKLMIIDGNSIVNRAFYGVKALSTKNGLPTNGIYGFMNILLKNLSEEKPDYLIVAFDLKAPTFRHREYAAYKAQRKGMPEDLAVQMPHLKELLEAMNIKMMSQEGYEADDIIGTVSKICENNGILCDIVTGDRDDLQLASKSTRVLLTTTKMGGTSTEAYDETAFFEKYHVTPTEYIDVKGLMGDSSDNIPGVSGIGEKTAFALIEKFHSISGVYENLDDPSIKPAARKKLEAGKDDAFLSRHLSEIIRDMPIELDLEGSKIKEYNKEKLTVKLEELEMRKLLERFGLDDKPDIPAPVRADSAVLKSAGEKDSFFFYIEKDLFFDCGGDFFCPIEEAKEILENESIKKYTVGYKKEKHILDKSGIKLKGEYYDFEIAQYVIDPSDSSDGAEEICSRYKKAKSASALISIYDEQMKKIKENGQEKLLFEVELPLCEVLYSMENTGFAVNRDELATFGAKLGERISALEENIWFMAGRKFNINSTKQLGEVLFDDLGLPVVKKNKRGYSTDSEVLEKLSGKHPVIDLIAEYRMLCKLKSTYADGLLPVIGEDGRIHSTLNQTVTATGRISSTEPNLQNIPTRTELGREIRKMFVAGEGAELLGADYSQIELRVLTHISKDETMKKAFLDGEDIHAITASQVFNVPEFLVTPEMRAAAKTVNFGTIYGQGEYSLAKELKISIREAKQYIESYFDKYDGVRRYMKDTIEKAKEDGYVTTILGRRRYIEELKSNNHRLRSFGERVAMNTPIQGSAADIIKIAMVRVYEALKKEAPNSKLVMQVHDELIVETVPSEKEIASEILRREMEGAYKLDIPLIAEVKSGKRWYDTK